MPDNAMLVYSPVEGITFGETGMTVSEIVNYEQWQAAGEALKQVEQKTFMLFLWSWGDWLVYGSNRFPNRYSQAIGDTGKAYQTLQNYCWLARSTPKELRGLPHLGQSHYEQVVTIEDYEIKRDLLSLASKERWSAKTDLANAIKALNGNQLPKPELTPPKPGSQADQIDLLQQQQYQLEQENIRLKLEREALQNQVSQAKELLEPVIDQVDNSQRSGIQSAVSVLQSVTNGQVLDLIRQIISLYRQGDMSGMVNVLDKLCEVMDG